MLIRTQDRTCVCNVEKMNGISIAEKSDGTAFSDCVECCLEWLQQPAED